MFVEEHVAWGMLLSSLAGGSTVIGGIVGVRFGSDRTSLLQGASFKKNASPHPLPFNICAQVLRRPNDHVLAFLLGTAIGVMMVLAVLEMWFHSALLYGWGRITAGVGAGALAYRILQPWLPDFESQIQKFDRQQQGRKPVMQRETVGDDGSSTVVGKIQQATTDTKYVGYSWCVCVCVCV